MSPTEPNPKSLAAQLPADTYYQLVHTLSLSLPLPLTDSPEDLARRDHSAIAQVAVLHPANATEANLAALFVAHSEQAKHCLRFANDPETSPEWAMKCSAQAASMTRQALGALRHLQRMQAARQKLEADSEACDRAAWTEHCALNLMAEALASPPAPELSLFRESLSRRKREQESMEEPEPDLLDPTSHKGVLSHRRAALIRVLRQLDDPDADLIEAALLAAEMSPPSLVATGATYPRNE